MYTTALSHENPDGWAAKGARRHADPELFFPVAPGGPALAQLATAKEICACCTVRAHCLEFALETGQKFGVRGGASEDERRAIRRKRRRRRCRAAAPRR